MDNHPVRLDRCRKFGQEPWFEEGHPARSFDEGERSARAAALCRSHGIAVDDGAAAPSDRESAGAGRCEGTPR